MTLRRKLGPQRVNRQIFLEKKKKNWVPLASLVYVGSWRYRCSGFGSLFAALCGQSLVNSNGVSVAICDTVYTILLLLY